MTESEWGSAVGNLVAAGVLIAAALLTAALIGLAAGAAVWAWGWALP